MSRADRYDTLSRAFPVANEDDNAAATAQIADIKSIADATSAAIIVIHHLGKNEIGAGVNKARGASARPAAADIVVNVEEHESQVDVIALHLVKSRYAGKVSLYLRKIGEDDFEVVEGLDDRCASRQAQAAAALEQLLRSSSAKGTQLKDITEDMGGRGFADSTTRRALDDLLARGRVKKPAHGVYAHADNLRSAQSAHPQGPTPDEQTEQNEQTEQSRRGQQDDTAGSRAVELDQLAPTDDYRIEVIE